MSYTTVSRVENGKAAIDYVMQEKGHNGNKIKEALIKGEVIVSTPSKIRN